MKSIGIILLCSVAVASAQMPPYILQRYQRAACAYRAESVASTVKYFPFFESAVMTASNAPSPVRIDSDTQYSAAYQGWNAFRRDGEASHWNTDNLTNPHFIRYDCGANISNGIVSVMVKNNAGYGLNQLTIAGSQDGSAYTTLLSTNLTVGPTAILLKIPSPDYYRYIKLSNDGTIFNGGGAVAEIELSSADFDGAVMTTNNAPSPYVVSSDSFTTGYDPYYAFDRDTRTTKNYGASGPYPHWVKIDYSTAVVINAMVVFPYPTYGYKLYTLAGSQNDSDYTTIQTGTVANSAGPHYYTNLNTTAYRYYRLTGDSGWDTNNVGIYELTFKHYNFAP